MADENEIKIHSALPIALHPNNILPEHKAALDVDGSPGKSVLASAQSAYGQFYTALGEIVDTARVVHAAEMERNKASIQMYERTKVLQAGMYMTGDGKIAVHLPANVATELNSTIAAHFERAAPALDRALTQIREAKAKCEAEMVASIKDPTANNVEGLSLARELRDHVKGLPPGEAAMFVREAVKNKDLQIVSAVLNVKHFLTNLPPALHTALRNEAMATFAPVAAKQAEALAWLEQNTFSGGQQAVNLLTKTTVKIQPAAATSMQALNAMRKKGAAQ